MSQANDLFNDSMLVTAAVKTLEGVQVGRYVDESETRAIEVALARLAHLEKLADRFTQMRVAQRAFFQSRADSDLHAAKALEREVDKLVRG